MERLTLKQQKFFEKLKSLYSNKALPSYEKIAKAFDFKSKNSIKQYIAILKKENLIQNIDNHLYINKNYLGANLVSSYVRAGFASIMDDKIEKKISFDDMLNVNSPSTFVFKVSGDSMIDAGILDGDYVVVRKTSEAKINDIVLAVIDNEFTLKTYKKDAKGAFLEPQNKDYPILRPKFSLKIFGVAFGITRKIL